MRRKQPLVFWTFLIAAASLSAFPLITAGFYSKELILYEAFTFAHGGLWLYLAGIIGAFITTLYTFRMVFVVFFDNEIHIDIPPAESPKSGSHAFSAGKFMAIPLIILAILSIVAGFIELPVAFGHISLFSAFMSSALPAVAEEANPRIELILMTIAAIVDLLAITIAWLIWLRSPQLAKAAASGPVGSRLHRFWYAGWGFDWLYDRLLVRPFIQLAKSLFSDPVDSFFTFIAQLTQGLNLLLRWTQNGSMRWYAAGIVFGAIILLAIAVRT